jgi:exodeoxyribonuclease VII large subunit
MSEKIFSVSEINAEVRRMLEQSYIAVKGELAEIKISPSWAFAYFVVKDEKAELPCVMPRRQLEDLGLQDGQLVVARGALSLYERRGRFQLRVDSIEEAGLGTLQARIEKLKKKLELEGLFSPEHKRELPAYPQRIVVISSQDGAAYKDFFKIAQERFPALAIILADVHVQGEQAPAEIVDAFEKCKELHDRAPIDAIVLTRGGGSLEDLMSFNDEGVARAIAEAPVPVISAVGHERDITIADLVEDIRASTPSNAAELAVPDAAEVLLHVLHASDRANNNLQQRVSAAHERLRLLLARALFTDESQLLRQKMQRVTEARMGLQSIRGKLSVLPERLTQLEKRLRETGRILTRRQKEKLEALSGKLSALNPTAILARGYSIVTASDGALIRTSQDAHIGQKVDVRLHEGHLSAKVVDTHKDSDA